jgi:hypothetical protein
MIKARGVKMIGPMGERLGRAQWGLFHRLGIVVTQRIH